MSINWDLISDISTVVIALLALGFTIYQDWKSRRTNKKLHQPMMDLELHNDFKDQAKLSYSLLNFGVGPGKVITLKVSYNGIEYTDQLYDGKDQSDLLLNTFNLQFADSYYVNIREKEFYLKENEKLELLTVNYKNGTTNGIRHSEFMLKEFKKIMFEIKYQDIFGKKYSVEIKSF